MIIRKQFLLTTAFSYPLKGLKLIYPPHNLAQIGVFWAASPSQNATIRKALVTESTNAERK